MHPLYNTPLSELFPILKLCESRIPGSDGLLTTQGLTTIEDEVEMTESAASKSNQGDIEQEELKVDMPVVA